MTDGAIMLVHSQSQGDGSRVIPFSAPGVSTTPGLIQPVSRVDLSPVAAKLKYSQ